MRLIREVRVLSDEDRRDRVALRAFLVLFIPCVVIVIITMIRALLT